MLKRVLAVYLAAMGIAGLPVTSNAQTYPSQPIRFIVPFAPGGGSDILGRLTAELLGPYVGQTLVVENKSGASGIIGTELVAKSKPDGYTLLLAPSDVLSLAPALKESIPYKVDDFAFIARISGFPYMIAVNPKLPIRNTKELVAYAKANPGGVRYGAAGIAAAGHLAGAMLANAAGLDLVYVPYRSSGEAATAAMGGHIDVVFAGPWVKSYSDAGTLRVVGIMGAERNSNFPDVPTMAESGLAKLIAPVWWGIVAPAGTPEPILAHLRKATEEMMKDPKATQRMAAAGFPSYYAGHQEFKAFVAEDTIQTRETGRSARITMD